MSRIDPSDFHPPRQDGAPSQPRAPDQPLAAPNPATAGGGGSVPDLTLYSFTLAPLNTEGPDALDTQGIANIERIKLLRIEFVQDNPFHNVTTRQADDLFASSAKNPADNRLIPKGARPTSATLAFQVAGSVEPQLVEIRPPKTVKFHFRPHAQPIFAWLSKGPLNTANNVLTLAIALLLSTAFACAPAFDDNDGDDDDDCDGDRLIPRLTSVSRFTHLSSALSSEVLSTKEEALLT